MSKLLSVAIPTYEYHDLGVGVLRNSFEMLEKQSFKDFDITISDDSQDNKIMNLCKEWDSRLDIKYHHNKIRLGASLNTNNAVRKSINKWIKLLCQDDWLFDENSLQIIADNLQEGRIWLFTDYVHSNRHTFEKQYYYRYHSPDMNPHIFIRNTLGTPSALTVKNLETLPEFDGNLTYCYDCEFYFRMFLRYGYPWVIRQPGIVNFLWENSVTASISQELIEKENTYILRKYNIENVVK